MGVMGLTAEAARLVVAAAEAKARAIGVPVAAVVVDSGANLRVLSRMTGAPLHSIENALRRAKAGPQQRGEKVATGGVIRLWSGGEVIGALGISGGSDPEDTAVAEAAAAAFAAHVPTAA
jgi:uncharacterized protein GlcG (DUF336 family)